jgi:diadenosine tetraphosphate (Ap4A) HIT family hydrolase
MPIFDGKYWIVEHAYPSGLLGWVVIVLKRHCEELHNLTREEWIEFSNIQYDLLTAMNSELIISKEYLACFAEMEGFKHIHFHVIPKTSEYDEENKGTKAFQYLKAEIYEPINDNEIIEYCRLINNRMSENRK